MVEFNVRHSSNNNTNRHTLTVNQFNSASARVTIRSTPQEVVLPFNQDVEVDIDGDGISDLIVRYTGFSTNQATIFIQEIEQVVEESQEEQAVEDLSSDSSSSSGGELSIEDSPETSLDETVNQEATSTDASTTSVDATSQGGVDMEVIQEEGGMNWIVIFFILILLVVVGGIGYFVFFSKTKEE